MSDYSHKDFTGKILVDRKDMDDQTIRGSCFSHETPDTHVFPDDVAGLRIEYCNLDNVYIPPGVTVFECSNRRFLRQNDGWDWIVDENNEPVCLLNEIALTKRNIEPPTPEDIPDEMVDRAVSYTDPSRNVRE